MVILFLRLYHFEVFFFRFPITLGYHAFALCFGFGKCGYGKQLRHFNLGAPKGDGNKTKRDMNLGLYLDMKSG